MSILRLHNLDDDETMSVGFCDTMNQINLLNADHSLSEIWDALGTDFVGASVRTPQSATFSQNWKNLSNIELVAVLNFWRILGTISITNEIYFTPGKYYQYKNGRYVRVNDNVWVHTYCVYEPLDPENPNYQTDTMLFAQDIPSVDRDLRGYKIPSSVPNDMTINQFNEQTFYCSVFSRTFDEQDVVSTWEAFSRQTNELAWIYYLIKGTELDPEEETDEDPYSGDNGPYPPGGPNAGNGDRPPYDEGDDIPIPDLPPFNIGNSAFTSLWIPSIVQLNLLSTFMWSDNFVDTVVKKLYANPIDVIISLGIVPFNVTPDGTANICVGDHDTGISSAYVDNDCVIIDCGSINITEMKPGGYLNYAPYTKAQLFLPFVGYVELDINEIMLSELSVEYHVCLSNGSFVVFITSENVNTTKVIGQYEGNMKIECPVNSADYSQMWNTIVGTLTAPLLAAGGGAAAGALSGQFIGASAALTSDFAAEGANQGLSNSIGQGISNSSNLLEEKLSPNIQRSGTFSSSSGVMGNRKPYIILKSPEINQPGNYNKYRGYPLQAEIELGNCEGYTEISNVLLSLPSASGTETCEVERLLRSGVIFGVGDKPQVGNDGIYLCQNSSPVNQIGKKVSLKSTLTGDFRQNIDMMSPIVRIEKTDPLGFNYVYIGEFQRWYFVNKIDIVRTGILDLHLKEDVLESFADEIKANKAIISNNEKVYNLYLNDNQLIHTQRDLFWRKEFPSGFLENDGYEWVLLVAGKRGSN